MIALCTAVEYDSLDKLKQSAWWIEPAQTVRISFNYADSTCLNCKITDVAPGDAIYLYQPKAINDYDCRMELQLTDNYKNEYLERVGMGFDKRAVVTRYFDDVEKDFVCGVLFRIKEKEWSYEL